jgi:hypothetical protein
MHELSGEPGTYLRIGTITVQPDMYCRVYEMTDKPEYIGICFACGKPLTLLDLAVTIEGRTVDWDERTTIDNTKSTFCRHCANKAKEYLKGGIKEAVKRYEMDEQTIARLKELDENDLMKAARSEIMIGS